jgi:hypothetical protein
MKRKEVFTTICFSCGIASLTTWIIPVLSICLAVAAIVSAILAWGGPRKWFVYSGLGMGILALIQDGIYYYVTMT